MDLRDIDKFRSYCCLEDSNREYKDDEPLYSEYNIVLVLFVVVEIDLFATFKLLSPP